MRAALAEVASRAGDDEPRQPSESVPAGAIKALNKQHGPAFRAGKTISVLRGAEELNLDVLIGK